MSEPKITLLKNGPILVSGAVSLVDGEGASVDLAGRESFALCRCDSSKNKPFCDGSHKSCGYQSD